MNVQQPKQGTERYAGCNYFILFICVFIENLLFAGWLNYDFTYLNNNYIAGECGMAVVAQHLHIITVIVIVWVMSSGGKTINLTTLHRKV